MDAITYLKEIDWFYVVIGVIALLLAYKFVATTFDWFVNKFGLETKRTREKREDHELLIQTSKNLTLLQQKHEQDEIYLTECLSKFIEETKKENQEVKIAIQTIVQGETERNKQIDALMCGSKELLGSTIDQLYNRYIELDGIPENEVDEFDEIFFAYKELKGNHSRDTKYNYVKNHLKVIPVKMNLVLKNEEL